MILASAVVLQTLLIEAHLIASLVFGPGAVYLTTRKLIKQKLPGYSSANSAILVLALQLMHLLAVPRTTDKLLTHADIADDMVYTAALLA